MFLVVEKLPGYYDFPVIQRITHRNMKYFLRKLWQIYRKPVVFLFLNDKRS